MAFPFEGEPATLFWGNIEAHGGRSYQKPCLAEAWFGGTDCDVADQEAWRDAWNDLEPYLVWLRGNVEANLVAFSEAGLSDRAYATIEMIDTALKQGDRAEAIHRGEEPVPYKTAANEVYEYGTAQAWGLTAAWHDAFTLYRDAGLPLPVYERGLVWAGEHRDVADVVFKEQKVQEQVLTGETPFNWTAVLTLGALGVVGYLALKNR